GRSLSGQGSSDLLHTESSKLVRESNPIEATPDQQTNPLPVRDKLRIPPRPQSSDVVLTTNVSVSSIRLAHDVEVTDQSFVPYRCAPDLNAILAKLVRPRLASSHEMAFDAFLEESESEGGYCRIQAGYWELALSQNPLRT